MGKPPQQKKMSQDRREYSRAWRQAQQPVFCKQSRIRPTQRVQTQPCISQIETFVPNAVRTWVLKNRVQRADPRGGGLLLAERRQTQGMGKRNSATENAPGGNTNHQKNEAQLLSFSCSVMSNSLQSLHGLQHTRFPHPSPSPGTCSNSHPLSQ